MSSAACLNESPVGPSLLASILIAALSLVIACDGESPAFDAGPEPDGSTGLPSVGLDRHFRSADLGGCLYASPQMTRVAGEETVIVITRLGRIVGLDPDDGSIRFDYTIETTDGGEIQQLSTPAIIDDAMMVVAWQEMMPAPDFDRLQRAMVFDLETGVAHTDFPRLDIAARVPARDGSGEVVFQGRWQLQRTRLVHRAVSDRDLGLVYLAYGNGPSDQPFYGWLFELDMDAWRAGDTEAAMGTVFNTAAENGCGPPGNRDPSVCGGGIWTAWALQFYDTEDGGYEIHVPTGNGRMDLDRGAYAHAVLRLTRGLEFETGCDPVACADFDEWDPDPACLETCEHIFFPRLMEGEPPLRPSNGLCDDLNFVECYGRLDLDLGANSPVRVDVPGGPRVVVQPGKDGALYLFDAAHFGRMYERLQIRDFCGTPEDECLADWAGTFVTRAAATTIDGDPVVVVASLMLDRTHYSGVSAYRVVMEGDEPRFQSLWDVPARDSAEANQRFRAHPGFPLIAEIEGEPFAFVLEVRRNDPAPPAFVWVIRMRDGFVTDRVEIEGAGNRYVLPLLVDDRLYLNDCEPGAWHEGSLEAFRVRTR